MTARAPYFALVALACAAVIAQFAWPSRFIVDDAYFYLVTARHLAQDGHQSFSNVLPTNGVHPLWLYVLTAWSWGVAQVQPAWLIDARTFIPLEIACLVGAGLGLARLARALSVSALPLVVAPLAFLLGFGLLHTEAALLACVLAWTLVAALRPRFTLAHALAFGLLSALTALARLDTIFVLSALHAWTWLQRPTRPWKWIASLSAALPVAVYAFLNRSLFGGFVPVSGLLKSTFPQVCLDGWQSAGINTAVSGYSVLWGWMPVLVAVSVLWQGRHRRTQRLGLLAVLTAGCAAHGLYTAAFTHHVGSWLWHYVAQVLLLALGVAVWLKEDARAQRRPTAAIWLVLFGALGATAYTVRLCARESPRSEAQVVLDWLEEKHVPPSTLLVSDAAGEIAFRSQHRVIGLDLLTTSPQFVAGFLAAPDPLDFLLREAALRGQPVQYVILTTQTWLAALKPTLDRQEVTLSFLRPGTCAARKLGRHALGLPLTDTPGLIVWSVGPAARTIQTEDETIR